MADDKGAPAVGATATAADATTGHEWDGIRELNTPLPRWWLYILYATILWSIAYWIVYPAWPLLTDHTRGWFGFSQRAAVLDEVETARNRRLAQSSGLIDASLEQIRSDSDLLRLALANGRAAFGDNCASCHGVGATGRPGYPNLQDDDWLWGGSLAEIERTIRFGVRSSHKESRPGEMPAFGGANAMLKPAEIESVANYVLSLSGKAFRPAAGLDGGRAIYAQNCASCHGERGAGKREIGAPDLTDAIWLNGSEPKQVMASITGGRKGVMPHWDERLDPITIKSLAIYIHSLGGGK